MSNQTILDCNVRQTRWLSGIDVYPRDCAGTCIVEIGHRHAIKHHSAWNYSNHHITCGAGDCGLIGVSISGIGRIVKASKRTFSCVLTVLGSPYCNLLVNYEPVIKSGYFIETCFQVEDVSWLGVLESRLEAVKAGRDRRVRGRGLREAAGDAGNR